MRNQTTKIIMAFMCRDVWVKALDITKICEMYDEDISHESVKVCISRLLKKQKIESKPINGRENIYRLKD